MAEVPKPEIIFTETTPPADQAILRGVLRIMHENPDFAERSLDVYAAAPEAISNAVRFIRDDPEGGLIMLDGWARIFNKDMSDLDIEFDPATQEAIDSDASYKKAYAAFLERHDEAERTRFRFRRIKKVLGRIREANAA